MEDIDLISSIIASKYRLKIIIFLDNRPNTPTNISKSTGIPISSASRALKELKELDLVISNNMRKGKLFQLTEKAKSIVPKLLEYDT